MTRLARAALWTVLAASVAAVPVALALLAWELRSTSDGSDA